jgi:hypothetical protein
MAEVGYSINVDLIRLSAWVVLAEDRLMIWSRRDGALHRYAAIPRSALSVVGLQWDTPNLIVAVSTSDGLAQKMAFSPDDGRFRWRGNVARGENAYRRAAAWIGAPTSGR